ncbi:AEC family transporter [Lentibacillus amyloliquefaciens]|uniref:Auxin efflux carrier n=1 Tax=Lentibacillus amyloliquefaciens TaxID=1472767 RepID=A0A0U4F2P9_9BACI|nr:AEC family transporter [Lentibacillus amyloliquefaciens]ALX49767.1 auxin efflux carrier [Lentibacillus amyloliquefaciens]
MDSAWAFLQEMIHLYVIALIGFMVRKKGVLNQNTDHVLTQLILYVTLPALILFSLDISFSFSLIKEFLLLLCMSAYILLLSIFLAGWLRRRSKLSDRQKSVYEGLIIFGNQGYIGFAVIFAVFGEQGIVYLTMFNVIYFIFIWTYGIYLFTKDKSQIDWRKLFLNPGVFSTLIGMLVLFLPTSWPGLLTDTFESVGKMTVPLSMILIGSLIANMSYKEFAFLLKNVYIWKAIMFKLFIIPLLLIPFAAFSVPFSLLMIAILTAGMPSAPTMSIYAQKFGADTHFASLGVMLSSLLGLFTIPLLYVVVQLIH